jgi:hypothetical protein
MAGNLAPHFDSQFFDSNGDPLSGGLVYSYQAGTSTPQATYTDSTLGTPNANPVVLDSAGRAAIWLDPTLSYKFVLQTSAAATIKTVDNVIGTLTADAVNTDSLQDGVLSADANGRAKMANDYVTADHLRDDASTDGNRAVTTNHIRDAAVTRTKLATGAVAKITVTASKTGAYTATSSDDLIPCSASGGAFTVTLPAAASNTGMVVTIKKTDSSSNAVTVDANGAETIDGATTVALSSQYEAITLACDGTGWHVI